MTAGFFVLGYAMLGSVDANAPFYPADCFSHERRELNERYATGLNAGYRLAERAWLSREIGGDCTNYPAFANGIHKQIGQQLVDAASGGPEGIEFPQAICRWYGFVDGMLENVGSKLADECDEAIPEGEDEEPRLPLPPPEENKVMSTAKTDRRSCARRGHYWGDFGARMYCDLSIALDGLGLLGICLPPRRPYPRRTCGERWTATCRRSFRLTSHGVPLRRFDEYAGCHQVVTVPESLYYPHTIDYTGRNRDVEERLDPPQSVDFFPVYRESRFDHCRYEDAQQP